MSRYLYGAMTLIAFMMPDAGSWYAFYAYRVAGKGERAMSPGCAACHSLTGSPTPSLADRGRKPRSSRQSSIPVIRFALPMDDCHIDCKQAKDQTETLKGMRALTHIRRYG